MDAPRPTGAAAALEAVQQHEAWAVIRLRDSATVTLVGGRRSEAEGLLDVPLEDGVPAEGRRFDRLVAIPFRQVAERGFDAHDDGTPLTVVDIDQETEVPLADLLAALPVGDHLQREQRHLRPDAADHVGVVDGHTLGVDRVEGHRLVAEVGAEPLEDMGVGTVAAGGVGDP